MTKYLLQLLRPMSLLFSNTAWLFGAELLAKISRVATIIVLAFMLSPVSYGTAMLALACHDLFSLLLKAGAGPQIIRCNDKQLTLFVQNGTIIQWGICLLLMIIQLSCAGVVANWYNNPQIAQLLYVMAITYLLYPWVSVRVFLMQRANNMRAFGIRHGLCVTAENLSIAIFAWYQADIMAVAYGKLVFSALWLILFIRVPAPRFLWQWHWPTLKLLLSRSGQIFSSELLKSLRLHLDTFIAAKVMSPELFGFYSFAKNAGIGLSQSIGNVFNAALYPFLCKLHRLGTLANHLVMIYMITVAVTIVFIAQAFAVPIYLPLLFDDKWQEMGFVVSVMCLVAVPALLLDTRCCLVRAQAYFNVEIVIRLICLLVSALLLAILAPQQPLAFAYVMLLSSSVSCVVVFCAPVFNKTMLRFKKGVRHEY